MDGHCVPRMEDVIADRLLTNSTATLSADVIDGLGCCCCCGGGGCFFCGCSRFGKIPEESWGSGTRELGANRLTAE